MGNNILTYIVMGLFVVVFTLSCIKPIYSQEDCIYADDACDTVLVEIVRWEW